MPKTSPSRNELRHQLIEFRKRNDHLEQQVKLIKYDLKKEREARQVDKQTIANLTRQQ